MQAEGFVSLAFTVGYGVLIFFFIWLWISLRRRQDQLRGGDLLQPLARELGLPVSRDPSTPMPFLRLDLRGLRAYFSLWSFGASSFRVISLLEIQVGCEGFLEATSRRGARHPTMTTRITQVDTATNYVIMTSQPRWAWTLVERPWMKILTELETTLRAPLRLQLTPSRVTIEAEKLLDAPGTRALLDAAGRILDDLSLSPTAEPVAILPHSAETGRCPVCGTSAEKAVACGGCRTPQHADCWAYLGRCGIFGCGGRPISA